MPKPKKPPAPQADRHKPRKLIPIPLDSYTDLAALAARNSRPVTWEAKLAIDNHVRASKEKPA